MPVSRTLPVAINRGSVHAIEPGTSSFETPGNFTIDLANGGQATHVHLHLDDELATVARLPGGNNHFVEAGKQTSVHVTVEGGHRPVTGRLKIVTGYGAETRYVEISIVEESEPERRVQVDERLSVKQSTEPDPIDGIVSGTTAVIGLAVVAVAIAIGALLLAGSTAVLFGAGFVILAIVLAVYFLVS